MSTPIPASAETIGQSLHPQVANFPPPSVEEIERLVREFELRQGELERENRGLGKTLQHLEAYRDRYIDLYDFAPLGYVTLDEEGFVQEINLAGAKLLGVERDALTGYPFGEYVAKEHQQAFLDHLGRCVRDHCEVTSELRLVAKDDRSITVQCRSIPIVGPEDCTLCKTAITDITERKNMEETIRQSQAFLQTVIDAIPDAMLVIGRDYRISLANRAAREMAGDSDPVAFVTCHRISHCGSGSCEGRKDPCPLHQAIQTKAPVKVMHTHYDANGNEMLVEVIAAPVFEKAGEVTHIIETSRDITDSKRVAAGIARDLRDPVSVLRQAAAGMKQGADDPAKRAEYLDMIEQQVDRIDQIAANARGSGHPHQGP